MHHMLLIAGYAIVAAVSAGQAQATSATCAARDLQVIAFIEQHGEAGDLPAARLGELGLMQLQARLHCVAGEETGAVAIYDDILGAVRTAERFGGVYRFLVHKWYFDELYWAVLVRPCLAFARLFSAAG